MIRHCSAVRVLSLAFVAAAAASCTPPNARVFEPVAHHTLRSGPDTEQDVVWVQQYDNQSARTKLVRCHVEASKPKCVTASE
jgi:hypothetical protein